MARKNQSSVLLNSGKIEDNIVIDAAGYNDSVDASVTTIILNNSNSNFIDMLNLLPDLFFYSADVFLNLEKMLVLITLPMKIVMDEY